MRCCSCFCILTGNPPQRLYLLSRTDETTDTATSTIMVVTLAGVRVSRKLPETL